MNQKLNTKITTDKTDPLAVENPFSALNLDQLPSGPNLEQAELKGPKESKFRGRIDVRREKLGRAGKTVTTLRGFSLNIPVVELEAVALKLKKICACGGSVKDGAIELQGDVRGRVMDELKKLGFKPIQSGG